MARHKPAPAHKGLDLLVVDFDCQVIPGSFEHAPCRLVDHERDLSLFHLRYMNDDSARPPGALIENILFIAVSGVSRRTSRLLRHFIFSLGDRMKKRRAKSAAMPAIFRSGEGD